MKKANQETKILHITAEQNGFDMLTRNISRNTFISANAKELYIYLNSHSENFNNSYDAIAKYLRKSTRTIARSIEELKEHGFLYLEKKENSNCYFYKLRTSPKIEQISEFKKDILIDAFFKNIIDINDLKRLVKTNKITKKLFFKIMDEIQRIVKSEWLERD